MGSVNGLAGALGAIVGHGFVLASVLVMWRRTRPVAIRGISALAAATEAARKRSHWARPND